MNMMRVGKTAKNEFMVVLALVAALAASQFGGGNADYSVEIQQWQQKREAGLRKPDGWLTVAGLSWLKSGTNSVGVGEDYDVVLPGGKTPRHVGTISLAHGVATFKSAHGVKVEVDGKPVRHIELLPDISGSPTRLTIGPLTMFTIKRGNKLGVRIKDRESKSLREFRGLDFFPVDPALRVEGRLIPNTAKQIGIPTVLGTVEPMRSPGSIEFELNGQSFRLDPVIETPDARELFFIFRDQTAGKETYGAGRFLYTELPDTDGRVILDFNRAENPPCAFTPYATCPLPPPQNKLAVRIEAGEKKYGNH